jgi:hypothetical protein
MSNGSAHDDGFAEPRAAHRGVGALQAADLDASRLREHLPLVDREQSERVL